MMKILVTGGAGFIGFHLCLKLLENGEDVVCIDNLNDYYDVSLKKDRLAQLTPHKNFRFVHGDIADKEVLDNLFGQNGFTHVVNLAAQAGVRYSLKNPLSYIQSNIVGFTNILESCRHNAIKHLVYASSSSVYGLNTKMPFSVDDNVDHPVSLYAATKKGNELLAHSYSHLYGLPSTGLRLFTVYGPWGRPDMALFIFTKAILEGKPIPLFNHGNLQRDFTYIADVVKAIVKIIAQPAVPSKNWDASLPTPSASSAPYQIYNLGNSNPIRLKDFINTLEKALEKVAQIEDLPMQNGDVPASFADTLPLKRDFGLSLETPLKNGIEYFVDWYKMYYSK